MLLQPKLQEALRCIRTQLLSELTGSGTITLLGETDIAAEFFCDLPLDATRIELVEDLRHSPDMITGDSVGDQLVRALRQISQVKARMIDLRKEKYEVERSELFELRQKVDADLAEGRDMLAHMANRTKTHINKAERRLLNLRNVNLAAEEYVKDKYGMDISDFR